MSNLQLALLALQEAAAASEALVRARRTYEVFKEAANRANELTPEQDADLDARAELVFASPASQPSGR